MTSGIRILLTTLLSLALIGCQQKKVDIIKEMYPEDQKLIEKTLHDIIDAGKKKELDRLEGFHLLGPKFTKFEDSGTRRDAQSAMKNEREGFAAFTDFSIDIQDLKVDVFGDVAIATYVVDFTVKVDETVTPTKSRATLVFVKDQGTWKITHEHFSPFKWNP